METMTVRDDAGRGSSTAIEERLATEAITFFATAPDRLSAFLAETGVDASSLRGGLRDPAFRGGVLDYVLGHEEVLVSFAQHAGWSPTELAATIARLRAQWSD
jgi:hypothetical protein